MKLPLTLATVKQHLRVEHADDDSLIGLYVDAVEEHVQQWCGRSFGATLPNSVAAAVLLGVGDLYENRESIVGNVVNTIPTMDRLLQPHRDYSNFFGYNAPPITDEFDPEPLYIGDDWSRVWRWKDSAGVAINVTGYTGTFELYRGETVVHTGALVVSNPVGGEFTFAIQDAVTATFDVAEHWYRVRVTSPGGQVDTLDRKRINVQ